MDKTQVASLSWLKVRFLVVITALVVPLSSVGLSSAASAAGGSSKTVATATQPLNLYMYIGKDPVTGKGSLVPKVEPSDIYTPYGTIIYEHSQTLPKPYGNGTTLYPEWAWSFKPVTHQGTGASLGWANLNQNGGTANCLYPQSGCMVIADVIAMGWAPLPANSAYAGSYYVKCLQFTPYYKVDQQVYLRWDSDPTSPTFANWVPLTSTQYSTGICNNS